MENIKASSENTHTSFWDSLIGMFGQGYANAVDSELVTKAMTDWKQYWLFPAGMAAVIFIIFAVFFWDKVDHDVDAEEVDEAASPDSESTV